MTGLKDFSLEGKNAWITGAAYGIGFSIAEAFVNAGIKNVKRLFRKLSLHIRLQASRMSVAMCVMLLTR